MKKTTAKTDEGRMISESRAALDEIVRQGARRMLQEALEHEVAEYLAIMARQKDGDGRQEIVRNGTVNFPPFFGQQRGARKVHISRVLS